MLIDLRSVWRSIRTLLLALVLSGVPAVCFAYTLQSEWAVSAPREKDHCGDPVVVSPYCAAICTVALPDRSDAVPTLRIQPAQFWSALSHQEGRTLEPEDPPPR